MVNLIAEPGVVLSRDEFTHTKSPCSTVLVRIFHERAKNAPQIAKIYGGGEKQSRFGVFWSSTDVEVSGMIVLIKKCQGRQRSNKEFRG